MVTGGFGGFGLETSNWLVENGARSLVVLSRSGASSLSAKRFSDKWREAGVELFAPQVDVSDKDALARVFETGKGAWPPLRGVIHCAALLDDSPISTLDQKQLERVFSVKAGGAWNLHCCTRGLELDFFLLYSSVSAVVGNSGQANYAAANAFLDGLAHHRRASGLPALSINWGAIGEVGMLARDRRVREYLERSGISSMPVALALRGLKWALETAESQVVITDVEWGRWLHTLAKSDGTILSDLATTSENVQSRAAKLSQLLELKDEAQRELALEILKTTVCKILRMDGEKFGSHLSLSQLGFDSLMSTELRNSLQLELGIDVPGMTLQKSTLEELAGLICTRLNSKATPLDSDVDDMSEEELDQLLLELQAQ